jgi:hypothetical protein
LQDCRAALESIMTSLAGAVVSADPDPFVVRALLNHYRATARADLFEVLGAALARGLDRALAEQDRGERAQWLITMADATALSDDELVRETVRALLVSFPAPSIASDIEACLRGAVAIGDADRAAAAIDQLERIVARAYEPGEGVVFDAQRGFLPAEQVRTASALLTAYDITGRLPYSMLAEELMHTTSPDQWADADIAGTCDAARILCRLAALNEDDRYRTAAVTARDARYRSDVEHLLGRYGARRFDAPRDAAAYGLALAQWLNLQ